MLLLLLVVCQAISFHQEGSQLPIQPQSIQHDPWNPSFLERPSKAKKPERAEPYQAVLAANRLWNKLGGKDDITIEDVQKWLDKNPYLQNRTTATKVMDRYDLDKDGEIVFDELVVYFQSAPPEEVQHHIGKHSLKSASECDPQMDAHLAQYPELMQLSKAERDHIVATLWPQWLALSLTRKRQGYSFPKKRILHVCAKKRRFQPTACPHTDEEIKAIAEQMDINKDDILTFGELCILYLHREGSRPPSFLEMGHKQPTTLRYNSANFRLKNLHTWGDKPLFLNQGQRSSCGNFRAVLDPVGIDLRFSPVYESPYSCVHYYDEVWVHTKDSGTYLDTCWWAQSGKPESYLEVQIQPLQDRSPEPTSRWVIEPANGDIFASGTQCVGPADVIRLRSVWGDGSWLEGCENNYIQTSTRRDRGSEESLWQIHVPFETFCNFPDWVLNVPKKMGLIGLAYDLAKTYITPIKNSTDSIGVAWSVNFLVYSVGKEAGVVVREASRQKACYYSQSEAVGYVGVGDSGMLVFGMVTHEDIPGGRTSWDNFQGQSNFFFGSLSLPILKLGLTGTVWATLTTPQTYGPPCMIWTDIGPAPSGDFTCDYWRDEYWIIGGAFGISIGQDYGLIPFNIGAGVFTTTLF